MACPQWPEEQLRDYLEALRSGVKAERISDPHHVTSRGAGGGDTADNVMPLCRKHHSEWDEPFKSPSYVIHTYPRVKDWLQLAQRQDILDRYTLQPGPVEAAQPTQETPTMASAINPRPKGQQMDKEISFRLTMAQVAEKAQTIAEIDAEIQKLEIDKKEYDAKASAQITERYARIRSIASVVRAKSEIRIATVVMQKCFQTNTVAFWHSEDGRHWDIVEERAMDDSERQMELDPVVAPAKTEKKKKWLKPEGKNEIAEEIKSETNKRTKRSAIDGVYDA